MFDICGRTSRFDLQRELTSLVLNKASTHGQVNTKVGYTKVRLRELGIVTVRARRFLDPGRSIRHHLKIWTLKVIHIDL